MADPAQPTAPGAAPVDTSGGQPKAALNYRQGGDHCGVCMYFTKSGDEKGTCPRVIPHDVAEDDLCDDFKRAGRERAPAAAAPGTSTMVDNLARRGMISDKAMAKMGSGY